MVVDGYHKSNSFPAFTGCPLTTLTLIFTSHGHAYTYLCSSLVPCSYSCSQLLSFQITDSSCCFSELPKWLKQSAHQLSIPDMGSASVASPTYHRLGGEAPYTGVKGTRRRSQCHPEANLFAKPTPKWLPCLKFH